MAKGRKVLGPHEIRRHFTITLDPQLAEMVGTWMAENNFDNGPEAIRALCRMAIAASPAEGLIEAMKMKAWNEVRHFSLSRVATAHEEIAAQMRDQLNMMVGSGG